MTIALINNVIMSMIMMTMTTMMMNMIDTIEIDDYFSVLLFF